MWVDRRAESKIGVGNKTYRAQKTRSAGSKRPHFMQNACQHMRCHCYCANIMLCDKWAIITTHAIQLGSNKYCNSLPPHATHPDSPAGILRGVSPRRARPRAAEHGLTRNDGAPQAQRSAAPRRRCADINSSSKIDSRRGLCLCGLFKLNRWAPFCQSFL